MADLTPYSTAKKYFNGLQTWMKDEDRERIASYQLYEEIYHNASESGIEIEDGDPILVPTAKILIEAIHRFLAVGWTFNVEGEDEEARSAFEKLFAREQIRSKVSSQKRYGLIRGDAMLHIVADPFKPAGSRISVYELDPASYFPIYDIDYPDRMVGAHLVEQIKDASDNIVIRRQTYRKELDENGNPTGIITSELALFELAGWDDRFGAKPEDIKRITVLEPEAPLPAEISSIPIYHWHNQRNPGDVFGSSAIRGLEKIIKSIDQTITDQDLGIALTSLGVYTTDSAPPRDAEGNETGWVIGPARVVELQQGRNFGRVPGIGSITPSVEHMNFLESKIRAGASVPAVAVGDVDVSTAESGIALSLRLLPLIAANEERELEMISVLNHFLYDLQTMWFPAYEAQNFKPDTLVVSFVRDPMPVNRAAQISETLQLLEAGLITIKQAVEALAELGWEYTEDDINELLKAAADKAAATADPFGDRLRAERSAGDAADETEQ